MKKSALIAPGRPIGDNVRRVCDLLESEGPTDLSTLASAMGMLPSYLKKYITRAEEYHLVTRSGEKFAVVPQWETLVAERHARSLQPPRFACGIHIRPANSAWELGHSRQVARAWPPACDTGRRFAPLGPWSEEA